jgi:RHS repeat-associated protein
MDAMAMVTVVTTSSYTYDLAEMTTKAGSTTYAYDNDGNMISSTISTATTNHAYDYEDQMVRAGTKSYGRDPFGRAISATTGTTRTDYLFDGAEVIQEQSGTATPVYYTRGLGARAICRPAGTATPSYYHYDSLGSMVGLTDGTKLTDSYPYDAFANVRTRSGTSTQPFQYVGNAYDSGTKLYDFHARAYDAGVGRFTSKDPIAGFAERPQTLNPYPYGLNGPLAHPDPWGLYAAAPGSDFSICPTTTWRIPTTPPCHRTSWPAVEVPARAQQVRLLLSRRRATCCRVLPLWQG